MAPYSAQDVGILTFHRTHNFGAFLQTYAIYRTLSQAALTPQVVDYQARAHWIEESWPVIRKFRRPIRLVDFIQKHLAFGGALRSFSMTPYTRDPSALLELGLQRVVVGSDIVWNYHLHGCNSPYFGAIGADKLIAYAPSFGWASPSDPPPAELGSCLTRFSAISVRDTNSQNIVKAATGRDATVVLDPTFLTDFAGDEVQPKAAPFRKPYLLVYAFDMTHERAAEIRNIAQSQGLTVIGVGYRISPNPCDHMLMGISPFEFLWAVKHATYVYTNTFHGSVFSIKYAKPFAVSMGPTVQPKLEQLLRRLGLEDRILQEGTRLGSVLTVDADFATAHARLSTEANASRNWLLEALKR